MSLLLPGSIVATATLGAAVMTYGTFRPRSQLLGRVIWRGDRTLGRVALTFDDGPTAPFTEQVLDILLAHKVRATFFLIGSSVQRYPDLLRRMHAEGHVLGNHTWNHPHYGFCAGTGYWLDQIRRTDDAIEAITGELPMYFRPPLGIKTLLTSRAARREGHALVAWSRRAFDALKTTPQRIIERLSNCTAGDIVLLHDGVAPVCKHQDRGATVEALPALIRSLRERGLEPVAIGEVLGTGGCPR